jgi:hypothetical protein
VNRSSLGPRSLNHSTLNQSTYRENHNHGSNTKEGGGWGALNESGNVSPSKNGGQYGINEGLDNNGEFDPTTDGTSVHGNEQYQEGGHRTAVPYGGNHQNQHQNPQTFVDDLHTGTPLSIQQQLQNFRQKQENNVNPHHNSNGQYQHDNGNGIIDNAESQIGQSQLLGQSQLGQSQLGQSIGQSVPSGGLDLAISRGHQEGETSYVEGPAAAYQAFPGDVLDQYLGEYLADNPRHIPLFCRLKQGT